MTCLGGASMVIPEVSDPQVLVPSVKLALGTNKLVVLVHVKVEGVPLEASEGTQVALEQGLTIILQKNKKKTK